MKTNIERTLETLVEFAAINRDNWLKTDAAIAALTEQQSQLTANVNKLSDKIDNLAMVTQSQQIITADLVELAKAQQATVDKLLAKN